MNLNNLLKVTNQQKAEPGFEPIHMPKPAFFSRDTKLT